MFITVLKGNCPLIITVPHDGSIRFPDAATRSEVAQWEREAGVDGRDHGTLDIARQCNRGFARYGSAATLLIETLHRGHVDVNRDPASEPYVDGFGHEYEAFHTTLQRLISEIVAQHGGCLLVDLHGYEFSPGPETYDIVLGSDSHRTCPYGSDRRIAAYLNQYRVVFSPDHERTIDGRYRGGWIVRSVAQQWRLNIVEAVQIELNVHMRQPSRHEEVGQSLAQALHLALQHNEK